MEHQKKIQECKIRQENERNKTQKEQTANSKMVDLNSSILLVLH